MHRIPINGHNKYPPSYVLLAHPVEGSVDGCDGAPIVTLVPLLELLLPSTGTLMLNFWQTSPNRVVKTMPIISHNFTMTTVIP
jgi:hypothetical protein